MNMRLRERLFPQWSWRLPPGHGRIALTFDDGPHLQSTSRLLSALHDFQIPVTMFMTGSACAVHSDLTRKCAAAGHSIGIHGFTHESCLWRSGNWQHASICRTVAVLAEQGIPFQRLYRPPFGHFNPLTAGVLQQLGFAGVLWSQLPRDWTDQPSSRIQRRLTSELHDGSIIVLHDRPQTIANVIECLPSLAAEVERRGWRLVPLSPPLLLETHTL